MYKTATSGTMQQSSTSALSNAIKCNNVGVCKINDGQYIAAINEFMAALSLVKNALEGKQHPGEEPLPACQQQISALQSEPCNYDIYAEDNYDQSPSNFFHTSPLRILSESVNECYDSCTRTSSIVIFNLALVYYLLAMIQNTQERLEYLRKCQSLYERAYSLHLNEKGNVDAIRAVACLNNLAHVNSLLQNEVNARKCWEMLLSLIVYLTESTNTSDSCGTELNSFMGNVIHLILKGAVSAPAA